MEGIWSRLCQKYLIPLFLKLDQRIQQLKIRINHIAGARTPEWWEAAETLARTLLETYPEKPWHEIRQALQRNLCISEGLAIEVMQRVTFEKRFRQLDLEAFR